MKIFIIDDEKVVNFITRRLLGQIRPGLDIDEFTDSMAALDAIPDRDPQLIFLDLNMPKVNGWDFLEVMISRGLSNKVVILSSSVSTIDQERAANYKNVVRFIEKPASREDLRNCLEAAGFDLVSDQSA